MKATDLTCIAMRDLPYRNTIENFCLPGISILSLCFFTIFLSMRKKHSKKRRENQHIVFSHFDCIFIQIFLKIVHIFTLIFFLIFSIITTIITPDRRMILKRVFRAIWEGFHVRTEGTGSYIV
jgi:hypothetical protein